MYPRFRIPGEVGDLMMAMGLSRPRPIGTRHVLVVEDDPIQQLIIDRVMQDLGPIVTDWASTAEEARVFLEGDEYDLVIADIYLGRGPTGMDLWEETRGSRPRVPFLFISGGGYASFLKGVGPNEISPPFLNKPIFHGEAAQMIESLLPHEGLKGGVS